MSNYRVAISAGHYPASPGACFGGFCEHEFAIDWAFFLRENLTYLGLEATTVRTGKLPYKVEQINNGDYAACIEIHFNSSSVVGVSGCETLYYPESVKGKLLASCVQKPLAEAMGNTDRGIKEGWYRGEYGGAPLFFLKETHCPAIIIEPEFIQMQDTIIERKVEACIAIAEGIEDFCVQHL